MHHYRILRILIATGLAILLADCKKPYADMANGLGTVTHLPVRGRIVKEYYPVNPAKAVPIKEISQSEIDNARVGLTLVERDSGKSTAVGEVQANEEGYIDQLMEIEKYSLEPGTYTLEVKFEDNLAGTSRVRLLDPSHAAPIVRSDVDMTYLDTDFQSTGGKVDLLRQKAGDRGTLPAMELVYRALRHGADGVQNRPLVFLSGSPTFFKRVLESKAALDGVEQDGPVLKPFTDIVSDNLKELRFADVVPDLKEQIGYKLYWLLRLRTEIPPGAPEILLGDDTEADFVLYNLYRRFLIGDLSVEDLLVQLDKLEVASSWRARIAQVAPTVQGVTGEVLGIYINRTPKPGTTYKVSDWVIPGLMRHHCGAWPLILDFFEEGWVSEADVKAVRARLEEHRKSLDPGTSEGCLDLEQAAEDAIEAGFLADAVVQQFEEPV